MQIQEILDLLLARFPEMRFYPKGEIAQQKYEEGLNREAGERLIGGFIAAGLEGVGSADGILVSLPPLKDRPLNDIADALSRCGWPPAGPNLLISLLAQGHLGAAENGAAAVVALGLDGGSGRLLRFGYHDHSNIAFLEEVEACPKNASEHWVLCYLP